VESVHGPDVSAPPPGAALVVLVPEADAVVGRVRDAMDSSAAAGLGAHETVTCPFASVRDLAPKDAERLRLAVRSVPPFHARFRRTERFADAGSVGTAQPRRGGSAPAQGEALGTRPPRSEP
jgi:hypothetical protein